MMKILFQDVKKSIFFNGGIIKFFKVDRWVENGDLTKLTRVPLILNLDVKLVDDFLIKKICKKNWVLEYLSFTFNR
jgi:hypothetical protein